MRFDDRLATVLSQPVGSPHDRAVRWRQLVDLVARSNGDADRDLLMSATGNLLQNAFKFSHARSEVSLNAYAVADRILIDVEDHCGGLPAGAAERMFAPFVPVGADTSGLGLGLSISRRSVEANDGILSVRNVPRSGCVFTIDLPRHSLLPSELNGRMRGEFPARRKRPDPPGDSPGPGTTEAAGA